MDPGIWQPRGQSRIIDSDGSVLGQLAEEEGVLTANAVMDLARKHNEAQPCFGGWLQPGPWAGRQSSSRLTSPAAGSPTRSTASGGARPGLLPRRPTTRQPWPSDPVPSGPRSSGSA